jgi:dTDP-4-amino-4,6-dideoxygalactose transaminase
VDKYTWVDVGSSYLPSDLLAAFLYAQLEARESIQCSRKRVWERYYEHLKSWADAHGVGLPCVPAYCEQSYHMFYLVLPSHEVRNALMACLKERGVLSVFHYQPLHLSEFGRRYGGKVGDCPVTESVSERVLRLPFYTAMTEAEQATVISALLQFDKW